MQGGRRRAGTGRPEVRQVGQAPMAGPGFRWHRCRRRKTGVRGLCRGRKAGVRGVWWSERRVWCRRKAGARGVRRSERRVVQV
jgi:hypothetical protein